MMALALEVTPVPMKVIPMAGARVPALLANNEPDWWMVLSIAVF